MPSKPLPNNMVLRILSGGFLAGISHKDKLVNFDPNISKYDEVIIESPIWNGKLSCPINTVLDEIDLVGKKVTFILYSGRGDAPKATKKINELYKSAKVIHIKEPKHNKTAIKECLKDL